MFNIHYIPRSELRCLLARINRILKCDYVEGVPVPLLNAIRRKKTHKMNPACKETRCVIRLKIRLEMSVHTEANSSPDVSLLRNKRPLALLFATGIDSPPLNQYAWHLNIIISD